MKKIILLLSLVTICSSSTIFPQMITEEAFNYYCKDGVCGIYNITNKEPVWIECVDCKKYIKDILNYDNVIEKDIVINESLSKIKYYLKNNYVIVLAEWDGKYFY